MNNQAIDFLIILTVKLLLMIGFISFIKFWKNKSNIKSNIPMIIYWILGLFFVFALSSQIFEALLYFIPVNENNSVFDRELLKSLASLLGLIFYILIGVRYLKNSKQKL